MITYTFYPNSVPGVTTYIEVLAHNYIEAKHKVLKIVYTHTQYKHPDHIIDKMDDTGGLK